MNVGTLKRLLTNKPGIVRTDIGNEFYKIFLNLKHFYKQVFKTLL